jgi:A/G-specific adenine glycosylase
MTKPTGSPPWALAARRLTAWYRRHRRDLPWRRTPHPYRIWISEIMLQQTQVSAVIPYYSRFLSRFPTLRALASAGEEEILSAWSGLGYYRRARSLGAAARRILAEHGGRIPRDPAALRRLPGIGRYTAGALASIAFELPEPALDGNAERVLSRLLAYRGDAGSGEARGKFEAVARCMMGSQRPSEITQGLMELGALICTPRSPDCSQCPLASDCRAWSLGLQDRLPVGRRGRGTEKSQGVLAIVRKGKAYLMVRRRRGELLEGLWEFPGDLLRGSEQATEGLRRVGRERLGRPIAPRARAATFSQSITYRRIQVSAYEAIFSEPPAPRWQLPEDARWMTLRRIAALPHGAATARLLAVLADPPVGKSRRGSMRRRIAG